MFGVTENAVRIFIKLAQTEGEKVKRIVGKPSEKNIERFHDWWVDPEEQPEELPAIVEQPMAVAQETVKCPIASCHLSFTEVGSWSEIIGVLQAIPLPSGAVISVNVQRGID